MTKTLDSFPDQVGGSELYAIRSADLTLNRMLAGLAMPVPELVKMPNKGRGWAWHLVRALDLLDLAATAKRYGFAKDITFRELPYRYTARVFVGNELGEALANAYLDGATPEQLAVQFIEDIKLMRAASEGGPSVVRS